MAAGVAREYQKFREGITMAVCVDCAQLESYCHCDDQFMVTCPNCEDDYNGELEKGCPECDANALVHELYDIAEIEKER
jgi:hypothetical protein